MSEAGGEFSLELEKKGQRVTEYYANLQPDAPASPPPPNLQDILRQAEERKRNNVT